MNNNQKATKRALLTSVMALVMCVVMLVGTTFAWFTDTASTGVNKIQAGNLDIELEYKNDTTRGEFKPASKETAVFNNSALWEPGHVEYVVLKVSNVGNLALKYKLGINIASETGSTNVFDKSFKLSDFIKFAVIDGESANLTNRDALVAEAGEGAVLSTGYTAENHLLKDGSKIVTLVVWMPTDVGNEANHKTDVAAPSIDLGIKVDATQYTHENDSFNNQYDKDATYLTYPAGVTTDSFPATANYINDQGQTKSDKPATVAFVDENGATQYAADLNTAITNGASVVYCKKDAKLVGSLTRGNNRTGELTSDLTIYANGADFQNTEISINATSLSTESVGKTKNFTLRVNDAKNIRIWGATPNNGVTQDIILENCTFEGKGINSVDDVASGGIFYLTGSTGTVNLTMNNCKVSGSNQGVYLGCNGNITVTNSAFEECAAGMKISHKATGVCNVTVKDTTFNKCGWDTSVAEKPWLTNDSSSIKCKTKGTMTLTLDNVAINNVVGNDSIVVDGDTDYTGKTTVSATNVTVDGAAWSANTTNP